MKDDEVIFDTENPIPLGDDEPADIEEIEAEEERDALRDAINESVKAQIEVWARNDFIWGQEHMGTRKYISVAPLDDERRTRVMLDDEPFPASLEMEDALLEAEKVFGAFTLAVDEYKQGKKTKFAISQATVFKGKDLHRTITEVRISAARELYGFLVNRGLGDRVMLLNTAKSVEEKLALKNPQFFSYNGGYEAP